MSYFILKSLIEGKHTLYKIQKFMTAQCLVDGLMFINHITNNLLAVTQTGDVVSRNPKGIKWK